MRGTVSGPASQSSNRSTTHQKKVGEVSRSHASRLVSPAAMCLYACVLHLAVDVPASTRATNPLTPIYLSFSQRPLLPTLCSSGRLFIPCYQPPPSPTAPFRSIIHSLAGNLAFHSFILLSRSRDRLRASRQETLEGHINAACKITWDELNYPPAISQALTFSPFIHTPITRQLSISSRFDTLPELGQPLTEIREYELAVKSTAPMHLASPPHITQPAQFLT
jgi:hypothetical protein